MFEEKIISKRLVPFLKPRFFRVMSQARSHSMVSRNRMQNLWRILGRIERSAVPGDYVEMGTARGGTAILLCSHAASSAQERQIWLYDAFEDFEPPEARLDDIRDLFFRQLQFDPSVVHVLKGFFDKTIPERPRRPIAFLHIDASGYEPVKHGLETFFDLVSPGGWVVFDNYGADLANAGRAVDEFLSERSLKGALQRYRGTQAYVQKPADVD
jgi:O-methyltransferase